MPWLSDPSQTAATTSWLNNPAVAFIGLVASVISVIQGAVAVVKWTKELAGKEDARRRTFIYFSTVCAVVCAIMVPLTWAAIVRADIETHDPVWVSNLFPVIPPLTVLTGCFCIAEFDRGQSKRPSLLAVGQVALGLLMQGFAYGFFTGGAVWERLAVDILPVVGLAMAVPMFLAYGLSKKPEHEESAAPAAS